MHSPCACSGQPDFRQNSRIGADKDDKCNGDPVKVVACDKKCATVDDAKGSRVGKLFLWKHSVSRDFFALLWLYLLRKCVYFKPSIRKRQRLGFYFVEYRRCCSLVPKDGLYRQTRSSEQKCIWWSLWSDTCTYKECFLWTGIVDKWIHYCAMYETTINC